MKYIIASFLFNSLVFANIKVIPNDEAPSEIKIISTIVNEIKDDNVRLPLIERLKDLEINFNLISKKDVFFISKNILFTSFAKKLPKEIKTTKVITKNEIEEVVLKLKGETSFYKKWLILNFIEDFKKISLDKKGIDLNATKKGTKRKLEILTKWIKFYLTSNSQYFDSFIQAILKDIIIRLNEITSLHKQLSNSFSDENITYFTFINKKGPIKNDIINSIPLMNKENKLPKPIDEWIPQDDIKSLNEFDLPTPIDDWFDRD